jgi:hypothetical protein
LRQLSIFKDPACAATMPVTSAATAMAARETVFRVQFIASLLFSWAGRRG